MCTCVKCVKRRRKERREDEERVIVERWYRVSVLNPQDARRRCRVL
jgi:hypothetical protein